jgi:hypothetical protein
MPTDNPEPKTVHLIVADVWKKGDEEPLQVHVLCRFWPMKAMKRLNSWRSAR